MIIHQHRAHYTVLYHEYLDRLRDGDITPRPLMFPLETDLLPAEIEMIEQHADLFLRAGFRWETEGERLRFTSLPAGLEESRALAFVEQMLAAIEEGLPEPDHVAPLIARRLAKAAAVPPGRPLDKEARERLLAALLSLQEPLFAPGGKRNFIILDEREINKRFQ